MKYFKHSRPSVSTPFDDEGEEYEQDHSQQETKHHTKYQTKNTISC